MPEESGAQGDPPSGGNAGAEGKLAIELDGQVHELSAEDVAAMLKERSTVTQQGQKVASILKAAERYGVEPDELVTQAEGAFGKLTELIELGILDKDGNVVQQKVRDDNRQAIEPPVVPPRWSARAESTPSEEKFLETVKKALEPLQEEVEMLKQDQARMIRLDVERELKAQYPELGDEDIARVFARSRDRSKSIWDHAKELAEGKRSMEEQMREEFAKEFGIDLKEWQERNKLKEQDAKAVSTGLLGNRKPSFKKGEGRISPAKATEELFKHTFGGGR